MINIIIELFYNLLKKIDINFINVINKIDKVFNINNKTYRINIRKFNILK